MRTSRRAWLTVAAGAVAGVMTIRAAPVPKDTKPPPTDPKILAMHLIVTRDYDNAKPDYGEVQLGINNLSDQVLEVHELPAGGNSPLSVTGLFLVVRFSNGKTVEFPPNGRFGAQRRKPPLVLPRAGQVGCVQNSFELFSAPQDFTDEFRLCKKFCVTAIIKAGDLKVKSNTCNVNGYDDKTEYDPFEDAEAYHERLKAEQRAREAKRKAEQDRPPPEKK